MSKSQLAMIALQSLVANYEVEGPFILADLFNQEHKNKKNMKGIGLIMELILMFVAGLVVFIIAVISIIKGVTHRITSPTDDLREEISNLKRRVNEIEKQKR